MLLLLSGSDELSAPADSQGTLNRTPRADTIAFYLFRTSEAAQGQGRRVEPGREHKVAKGESAAQLGADHSTPAREGTVHAGSCSFGPGHADEWAEQRADEAEL